MGVAASVNGRDIEDSFILELKDSGDKCFKIRKFFESVYFYTLAIDRFNSKSGDTTRNDHMNTRNLAVLYSNRSAAFFELGLFESAFEDGRKSTEIDAVFTKGYFRTAVALMEIGNRRNLAALYIQKGLSISAEENCSFHSRFKKLSEDFRALKVNTGRGSIYSWGLGSDGQLGHVLRSDKSVPTIIETLRGMNIVDVACGAMHTVAVSSGNCWAWGGNSHGQCGITDNQASIFQPAIIPKLVGTKISSVSCGAGHSIAISSTGAVFTD